MEDFIDKYSEKITGVVSCFDRILFKGYLPVSSATGMEALLSRKGLLIKDFKGFVMTQSNRIGQQGETFAQKAGRPFLYLQGNGLRKEDEARRIALRDRITQGLVCVFRVLEPCQSFKLVPGQDRPHLVNAPRKCLCFYYYLIDRQFGLMHIRIQSWFPLVVQICINGHEWLGRKLDLHDIAYRKADNAFLSVENTPRAQRFADGLVTLNWPRILSAFARKVNPLMRDILEGMNYYWVVDQAEYATDLMFQNPEALKGLYPNLLRHAILCFSAEDVLTFLGRKLNGNFQGQVLSDLKIKRWPGARIKHRMCENWIKMYDKHGCVLRIETVINHPRQFKVRRKGKRRGQILMGWYPMAKGVANLFRYREISLSANRNYLAALAAASDSSQARHALHSLARPVKKADRHYRGFNPADEQDLRLFSAVSRGEHALMGFRNRDVRESLFPRIQDPSLRRRHAAHVSRLLKRLHAHRLIARIPRSRRWRITRLGHATLGCALTLYHQAQYPIPLQVAA